MGADVIGIPDHKTAAKLAAAATERGHEQVATYLTEVATFLENCGGQALIPVQPGDEVLIRRTTSMGTIPHPRS